MHPKQQLANTSIRPKKSFGQNFLIDEHHLDVIARFCVARAKDPAHTVVEMGAGLGALTQMLVEKGARVVAVERDRDLVPLLRARLGDRVEVHEDNALTFPLDGAPAGFSLAGNLPYHHAAELALRALSSWPLLGGACFLVQIEVAERMAAPPGNKEYGSLSVMLQSRFDVQLVHRVPKGAFWPVPDVDGGVLTFDTLPAPRGAPHALESLERLVRPAFQQRRKTVRNALKGVVDDGALARAGIDPGARAEAIDVDAWGRLASEHPPGALGATTD